MIILALKPVSTVTIKIRLTAEKIAFRLSPHIDRDPAFAAAFPSGEYFNVDVHTMSNGSTAMTLADDQTYPNTKEARRADNAIDQYLNIAASFL